MSTIVGTVIILAVALVVGWLINVLPFQVKTKRLAVAVFGAIVLLWLVKVLVVGGPFTWRP